MKAISIVALAFVETLWSYFLYKGYSGQSLGNDHCDGDFRYPQKQVFASDCRRSRLLDAFDALKRICLPGKKQTRLRADKVARARVLSLVFESI